MKSEPYGVVKDVNGNNVLWFDVSRTTLAKARAWAVKYGLLDDVVKDGRHLMNGSTDSPLPPSLSPALRAETDGENRAPLHGTGK